MDFYTYLHCRPDGTPFYVGKGYGRRSQDFAHRNRLHKNIVSKYGKERIGVFVFPCESEVQAIANEIQQIAQLRSEGYTLCNFTDGGDGISGLRHSEETKKKMSLAAIGNTYGRGCKGKSKSPETKARIAAAKLGKKLGPCSPERRAKIALSAIGNKRGLGNKSRLGQHASTETRARMTESQKKRWVQRKLDKQKIN